VIHGNLKLTTKASQNLKTILKIKTKEYFCMHNVEHQIAFNQIIIIPLIKQLIFPLIQITLIVISERKE
jgi:hypothetical protein